MKKIWEWAKEHPKLSIALVVGMVILFYLMSRKSAQASTDPTASAGVAGTGLSSAQYLTLQEAGLQASTQLQALQLQAGVQTSQTDAALQAAQSQQATQLAIAQLQAQVSNNQIAANASTSDTATNAALQASLAQTGAGISTAQIAATEATTIAQYQEQVSLAQIGATNNANNVITQLAGIIAGQQATTPAPITSTNTTTTTVPSVSPVTATTQITSPIVTSTPSAVNTPASTATPYATPVAAQPSALIPYGSLNNEQWYELLALTENQPLSGVQSYYGATVPGGNVTNLAVTTSAHSLAQSAYDFYSSGAIVYNPTASGMSFQWKPATPSSYYSANPWAAPTTTGGAPA